MKSSILSGGYMKKIIISDSLRDLLEAEHTFLNRAGMKLLVASSNEEILGIHRDVKADLIIADFSCRRMDGARLCAFIRDDETLRTVSIILLCQGAEMDPENLNRCRANAFVAKPVNPLLLLEKAHNLLHVPTRETYRAPISVRIHGEAKNKPFLCHAENISSTGMLFYTDRELSQGEVISCSFLLPDSTPVRTYAEVVRVVRRSIEADITECGVRFSGLDGTQKAAIEKYVRQMKKGW